jgi:hypothetical protein
MRVAQVMKVAASPLTTEQILEAIKSAFGERGATAMDINSSLYSVSMYGSVPGSNPVQWFLKGSRAEKAHLDRKTLLKPYNYPPVDVVPDGEFRRAPVAVCGAEGDMSSAAKLVALLERKEAGVLKCLSSHVMGDLVSRVAANIQKPHKTYVYPNKSPRSRMVQAHQKIMARQSDHAPVCLVVVGPPESQPYEIHHLMAIAEGLGISIYTYGVEKKTGQSLCKGC